MPSVATPPLSEWIHVACVYDNVANTKTLYLNGIQDVAMSTTAAATITPTTHKTYIGARANSAKTAPEAFFTGSLDEIRTYSRALSAGEVEYLSRPTP